MGQVVKRNATADPNDGMRDPLCRVVQAFRVTSVIFGQATSYDTLRLVREYRLIPAEIWPNSRSLPQPPVGRSGLMAECLGIPVRRARLVDDLEPDLRLVRKHTNQS